MLRLIVSTLLACSLAGYAVFPKPHAPIAADDNHIVLIRQDLAAVQMELMQVMQTDTARTSYLERRETQLKYALRNEQIRRDESARRHDPPHLPEPALARRNAFGTPRS